MPGKVKVKIIAGRNLPVMDRSSDTTDAYVEIKLGGTTYKTDVCRKSLHPQWNSEWYRFEVDDSELQDEPLQMRLMDHDTYSANDAIGKVYLNLNPLLLPSCIPMMKYGTNLDSNINSSKHSVLSGWIPVYDTMHGIRGEVNVIVKVELFSDFNKFRQSSCGVHFFYSPSIPDGYYAQAIYGFVEELIVSDDPEYQWIDKIRTPRASNEARQTLFFKLSGELQRKIGVKALELGANSVVGYRQCFDLEGEYGIVARGIGTAAFLVKIASTTENEEHIQSYLNPPCSMNSFRLKVEPFNNKYPFPFQNVNNSLTTLNMNQSKSFDQPSVMSKPITLVRGSSLKSLIEQEDNRYPQCFSQKVRNFKYNFIRDKDPVGRSKNFPSIPKRKFFAKKSERTSVMAEMLARSVLDCHSNLAPVIEHQDSGASDKSVSEKLSSTLSLPESVNIDEKCQLTLNIVEDSVDLSTQDSMSSESSSSDDISDNNELVNTVDETFSDIVRNFQLPKKTKRLVRQQSLSLNDLSSEYGSSLFSVLSRGLNQDKSCDSNLNILDKFYKDDISISSRFTHKYRMLSRSDNQLCFEKRELFLPEDSNNLEVSSVQEFIREDRFDNEVSAKSEPSEYRQQSDVTSPNILNNVCGDDAKPYAEVSPDFFPSGCRNEDPKIILPPIEIKGDIEKQSLVKTAMQTILLEKANIIGSYTPPVSPTVRVVDMDPSNLKLDPSNKCFSFPHVDPPNVARKIRRSGEQETVLGIRFQSISTTALSKYSNKRSFLSDRVLNKPITDFDKLKYNVSKTKSCFPNIVHVDIKKYSRKNSLIPRLHYSGLKRMSLFSKKSSNPLKPQRSFSSDDITPKNTLNKSHYLPKMLSRLSLFKQKDKKNIRSNSVFYVTDVTPSSDAAVELISHGEISPPPSSPVSELTPNIMPEDYSPPIFNSECCNVPNNKHATSILSTRCNPPPLPDSFQADHHRSESMGTKMSHSPAKLVNIASIHRRSSDSDLSVTPKGNSLTGSDRSGGVSHVLKPGMILRSVVHQDSFDMLEYPFLTISKYPPGFILHLGGAVSARSVKLLEKNSSSEEPETRDSWWAELRMEIRSHAKALNCNAVLGYTETCSICEDVCVLSAYGTAAVIGSPRSNLVFENNSTALSRDLSIQDKSESDRDRLTQKDTPSKNLTESEQDNTVRYPNNSSCMICHLPYTASMQFRSTSLKCCLCRVGKVPEVLITTIDATDAMPILGRGCIMHASVQRPLKDLKGEYNAKQISDGLPFLEYELHRIIVNKLKIKGMNGIFNLKIGISIGEKMLIGVATGTAIFLTPLQPPTIPKIVSAKSDDESRLADLNKRLKATAKRNRKIYQVDTKDVQSAQMTVTDELEEEGASLQLTLGSKECSLLEVDDPDDAVEVLDILMEGFPANGIYIVNTEMVPGLGEMEIVKNLQMFKRIYRSKVQQTSVNLNHHFQRLLKGIYFKLRRMVPCAVCDLQFIVDLPEGDEVQICALGIALGLADCQKLKLQRKNTAAKHDDLIFNLEEVDCSDNGTENVNDKSQSNTSSNAPTDSSLLDMKVKSPLSNKSQSSNQQHIPYRERYGVDISPLTYIPGGKIEKYLGNLNLFLVRESTSIREEGGPSGFVHSFATEVLAIVRAHVTALGGNGMVSYFWNECLINYNLHKNQGQCLINVGGDVVFVSYFKEE